jgi:hypothetical protein
LPGALAKVPEIPLDDWRIVKMGYGQSKLVSERLLVEASRRLGIRTAICRVGHVAGLVEREDGVWNQRERLPSLLESSRFLGKVPRTLAPVEEIDWVPVDVLGRVVVELLQLQCTQDSPTSIPTKRSKLGRREKETEDLTKVWHVVNPSTTTWSTLLPSMLSYLMASNHNEIETVGFIESVDALEEGSKDAREEDLSKNPAAKLITFFDDLRDKARRFPNARSATLDTKVTQMGSKTLRDLRPVTGECVELWGRQWDRSH